MKYEYIMDNLHWTVAQKIIEQYQISVGSSGSASVDSCGKHVVTLFYVESVYWSVDGYIML